MDSFNHGLFEEKLLCLKDSQESISSLSAWCLSNKVYHEKIVSTWLNVLKKVKIEHRLVLFYLANDVIQYSKRKSLPFVDSFAPALQKATKLVREDNVRNKIMRLFKIWSERGIYDEEFLVDLSNVLNRLHKNTGVDVQEFQSSVMFSKIRRCKELEEDTDVKLSILNEKHISFTDIDRFRKTLKDREHGDELLFEFDAGLGTVKAYIKALETEINERIGLIDLLEISEEYYEREFQEAKVVVNAYKCFATRVRGVKRKLEEQIETMLTPVPSPDANAPSPSPEPKDAISNLNEYSADYKPNNYFPPNELKKRNDDISPYSPDSDFDVELPDSTYLEETEEPGVCEKKKLLKMNGVENDSSNSKTIPSYELSDSISNELFSLDHSLSRTVTNSTPSIFQATSDVTTSSDVQQLSLSALLQTLIPSEVSAHSSVTKNDLFTNPELVESDNKPEVLWESPESPPLYEKANYPTIADEQMLNQDTDMRCTDVDERNFIELTDNINPAMPGNDKDYRTTGISKTTSIPSQNQDNVENIDMEMSDEEEKINKAKESEVKHLSPNAKSVGTLPISFQNTKARIAEFNDISNEDSFIDVKREENVSKSTILPKAVHILCGNNISITPGYSSGAPYSPSPYSNSSSAYGFSNNNNTPFKSCFPDFMSAPSGKGDASSVRDLSADKYTKSQPPPPSIPPPPPPPPPPHPSQFWSPSYAPPPPPQFGNAQNFSQQPLYFPRPPPNVLQTPQMPVLNRPYRGNFRPFQRVSSRFPRW